MGREAKPQALSRRNLLLASAAHMLGSHSARAAENSARAAENSASAAENEPSLRTFEQRLLDIAVPRSSALRTTLLVPPDAADHEELPLLILCHGLGETNNEAQGLRAWPDRYGLLQAAQRLSHPPLQRLFPKLTYFPEARLGELNQDLARRALRPCVIACPFTPTPYGRGADADGHLERFADYVEGLLIPEIRKQAPISEGSRGLCLGGVSMGGYVALEVVARRPQLFARVASIQGAFGTPALGRYHEALLRASRGGALQDCLLLTSTDDPFRNAHQRLARELTQSAVAHQFIVRPGPHNQPWLREVGSVELLYWHDRSTQAAALTSASNR